LRHQLKKTKRSAPRRQFWQESGTHLDESLGFETLANGDQDVAASFASSRVTKSGNKCYVREQFHFGEADGALFLLVPATFARFSIAKG